VLLAGLALVFLATHLAALPKTLEDIDSINFALGVERFDVWAHRPHPPGYPVFIAAAKLTTGLVGAVRPGWDRDRRAAAGLAIIGIVAAALGAFVIAEFWMAIGLSALAAWLAALLTLCAPMYWLTASRPLTDAPGLIAAVAVQAWLLRGLQRLRAETTGSLSILLWAAAAAGFIIGLRSQTLWLTAPLIAWVIVELILQKRARVAAAMVGAAAAGAFAWAIPLVWASGGLATYLRALRSQGSEDFSNIEMLWTTPTWKLFTISMRRTFIDPWQERTIAHVVLLLALVGIVLLVMRQRRALALVAVAFLPYLCFHLAFQETVTVRYGLPLLVPVAGLAVVALTRFGRYPALGGGAALAIAAIVIVQPRLDAYKAGAPVFLAMQDMHRSLPAERPALRMHHQVWHGVQRLFEWYRPVWDVGPQPFPGDREWLGIVQHFESGSQQPIWFMADVSRTDLAAFDPRTTSLRGRYLFPPSLRTLIGGARLDSVDWWTIDAPGWMLGRGWSLTPELAGVTERDAPRSVAVRSAQAFLRRTAAPMRMIVGGRYLGPDNGPAARVVVRVGDRALAEWTVSSEPRWFVQWIDVPAGALDGTGAYAPLTVDVSAAGGGMAPPVGLEQFDAAGEDGTLYALIDGWNEAEEDPSTGLQWRWTSGKSTIEVRGPAVDRTLELSGESPLKSYDTAPTVTIRAGNRELAKLSPAADFSESIAIPADALAPAGGLITIELDRTHSPSDKGSPDKRRLGLRLFSIRLRTP
jgi:hypothetical protein